MKRYAVYFAPRDGAFASQAAAWLGWDAGLGCAVAQPPIMGLPSPLPALTAEPRKYGFHGTLRAPFRLRTGVTRDVVETQVAALAKRLAPAQSAALSLVSLEGFIALVPSADSLAIEALAAAVVQDTNALRAPLTEAEIARRRPETLTPRQRTQLEEWGYPHVFEDFQFHLTLTGRLPADQTDSVLAAARAHFGTTLPSPFVIEDLCLFGEDEAGRFHLLHRYALAG